MATKIGSVTGSGTTYNVAVSGATGDGTVVAQLAAGVATDLAGNDNAISTSSDNSVLLDTTGPAVTIDQAAAQADPTKSSPINFTVVFTEPVTGFATGDVTISGTAGGTKTATVSGSGTTYNVAVAGMTSDGTVVATVAGAVAFDAAGNGNAASTSTDNSVTWTRRRRPSRSTRPAARRTRPAVAHQLHRRVQRAGHRLLTGDVTFTGTARHQDRDRQRQRHHLQRGRHRTSRRAP